MNQTIKFTGPIRIEVMDETHLAACKKIDYETSIPPWTNEHWTNTWDKKTLLGVVAWQNNQSNRRHIVGFALLERSIKDLDNLLKLCVKDEAEYDLIGTTLLSQFTGKMKAWVRGRQFKLAKLLSDNGFTFTYHKDKYTNPVDDGYRFEGITLSD